MDDLISRQAAIDEWKNDFKGYINALDIPKDDYKGIMEYIDELPSAQQGCEDAVYRKAVQMLLAYFVPEERYAEAVDGLRRLPSAQSGWIPWDSGRFPEESGTYTVTAYDGATKRVTYAKYQKRLKRWELTGSRAYWRVLAWMPHIEPWEGEKDGED